MINQAKFMEKLNKIQIIMKNLIEIIDSPTDKNWREIKMAQIKSKLLQRKKII